MQALLFLLLFALFLRSCLHLREEKFLILRPHFRQLVLVCFLSGGFCCILGSHLFVGLCFLLFRLGCLDLSTVRDHNLHLLLVDLYLLSSFFFHLFFSGLSHLAILLYRSFFPREPALHILRALPRTLGALHESLLRELAADVPTLLGQLLGLLILLLDSDDEFCRLSLGMQLFLLTLLNLLLQLDLSVLFYLLGLFHGL
mmetsp:Transcript_64095/g.111765  ORF Transcript_64095/g.111765 Transcript_64095/m.111765 type:complete len:200 (-) Transcript_64095:919-1518(-)